MVHNKLKDMLLQDGTLAARKSAIGSSKGKKYRYCFIVQATKGMQACVSASVVTMANQRFRNISEEQLPIYASMPVIEDNNPHAAWHSTENLTRCMVRQAARITLREMG